MDERVWYMFHLEITALTTRGGHDASLRVTVRDRKEGTELSRVTTAVDTDVLDLALVDATAEQKHNYIVNTLVSSANIDLRHVIARLLKDKLSNPERPTPTPP